jgi:hypothetical protein
MMSEFKYRITYSDLTQETKNHKGANMTRRLDTNLDRLAAEAGIELTPAIRRFAWLVNQDSLQGFWKAAQHYAEFEQEKVDRFLKEKWND